MIEISRREFIVASVGGLVACLGSQASQAIPQATTQESNLRDANLSELIIEESGKYQAVFNAYSDLRGEKKPLGYEYHTVSGSQKIYYTINCGETKYGKEKADVTVLIPAKSELEFIGLLPRQRRRLSGGKPTGPSENGPIYVRFVTPGNAEYISDDDLDGLPDVHHKGLSQNRASIENLHPTQISTLPLNLREAIISRFEFGVTRAVTVLNSAATEYFVG